MTILDGIETALRSQPGLPPSPFPQFPGQLPHLPSAVANGLAPETPLDIKMGLTSPQDVSHRLRWSEQSQLQSLHHTYSRCIKLCIHILNLGVLLCVAVVWCRGFMTAGRICKDMAMAIKIAQTRGCGTTGRHRQTGTQTRCTDSHHRMHRSSHFVAYAAGAGDGSDHCSSAVATAPFVVSDCLFWLLATVVGCPSSATGATLGAVAARKLADAEAFANDLGCARAYGGDSAYADICADPDM